MPGLPGCPSFTRTTYSWAPSLTRGKEIENRPADIIAGNLHTRGACAPTARPAAEREAAHSTDLAGFQVPLLLKSLGVVGHHAAQQGALVVLLGGPQQLQSGLQQLEEVLQHEARLSSHHNDN